MFFTQPDGSCASEAKQRTPFLFANNSWPLAAQVREGIIVVSGTNGKTTTTNMIAGVLNDAGYKVIANREGANMMNGVTTSFVMNALPSGKTDCDYAVIEVDEASIPDVLNNLT